ncbi:hypothetical protein KAU32_05015 [bacterium]|nr:hypothetical protein [bacterium]
MKLKEIIRKSIFILLYLILYVTTIFFSWAIIDGESLFKVHMIGKIPGLTKLILSLNSVIAFIGKYYFINLVIFFVIYYLIEKMTERKYLWHLTFFISIVILMLLYLFGTVESYIMCLL